MATVRPARAEDGPQIREIQSAALAEPWPALLDVALGDGPIALVAAAGGADRGTSEKAPGADGPIVGYAIALTADAPMAYVPELAVHPAAHRNGYGSSLLTALLGRLRSEGVERVRLTVRADDDPARSFYAACGFETVDRVPAHFESGDGLVLERGL